MRLVEEFRITPIADPVIQPPPEQIAIPRPMIIPVIDRDMKSSDHEFVARCMESWYWNLF